MPKSETDAADAWPKLRRATELRPGDIINTDGGVLTRNHLKTVELCGDGTEVKVTFANGQVRHIPAHWDEAVFRPGSI
jgi:hypothetical protein